MQGEGGFNKGILDMQTHLLDGMIHSNGFNHFLCMNGRERGSKYAFDSQIMDLYNLIYAMLKAKYYDLIISSRFIFSKLNNSTVSTSP